MNAHLDRQIKPPLNYERALAAVQFAEELWNTGRPAELANLFNADSEWWCRDQCLLGADNILEYLKAKATGVLHYRFKTELWSHSFSRLAIRYTSEWQNAETGRWFRTKGCMLVQLAETGLIHEVAVTANDIPIAAGDRSIGFVSPRAEGKS